MYDDAEHPSTLKQIQQLWRHDAFFGRLMQRLQVTAEAALGEGASPQNMQFFNKPPLSAYRGSSCGSSRPTPPHQDGYYFMLKPCRALTVWLALEEVDESNGCISYVRASHQQGLREHQRTKTLGFSQGITDFPRPDEEERMVKIKAQPGDLLIHDAMTIHLADKNC